MNVDRLYRNLLNKLINANIDLDAYLQLRKAKGYMSVSENEHLRDNLFELCGEMRKNGLQLQHVLAPEKGRSPSCRWSHRVCGGLPDERAS